MSVEMPTEIIIVMSIQIIDATKNKLDGFCTFVHPKCTNPKIICASQNNLRILK
jgi:hypothetical protein